MDEEVEKFVDMFNMLNKTYKLDIGDNRITINCSDYFMDEVPIYINETYQNKEILEQNRILEQVYHCLYYVIIPVVCVFGFLGNILNVIVFSKKKTCRTLDEIEYCTTICLVALAISDMMFCVCIFPKTFDKRTYDVYTRNEIMMYYKMYASFAINSFIMSSTLLTVLTAIMRYTAICHPFHSRQFISFTKTIIAVVVLFLFSFAFNTPHIWRFSISQVDCVGPEAYYTLEKGELFENDSFTYTHKLMWAVLGNFVPLVMLLYCNIRLVKALHASQKLRLLHSRDNVGCLSAHRRINITLITIIILFFILVAPSEISKFISNISNSDKSPRSQYTNTMVSMITNALQCINFSVNFILYYIIIAPFRKTLHEFICIMRIRRGTRDSSNSQKQQTCVLLTIKEQRRALI